MGSRKLWLIALAVWFALYAALALTSIRFVMQDVVMGVLALFVALLAAFDR